MSDEQADKGQSSGAADPAASSVGEANTPAEAQRAVSGALETMGYRGEDLDLRTPQTWSASAGDLQIARDNQNLQNGPRGAYRAGAILVDETVLACSNHAYDVSLAHRAGEVKIEHLLHALTRIEAAAEALEARGVRVAALRRESATIIASEIPVGLPNGKGTPRRSEEFAEALRLAAANAARRNAPAGIEDLLFVLFDQRSDMPGLGLLARHTGRIVREAAEPLPPLTRYVTDARYAAPPPARLEPRYAPETRYYRSEYAGTPTDGIQNSRLDALEQMMRAIGNDLAGERQAVSALLRDLNMETQAQRSDQGRQHSVLTDRMSNLEKALASAPDGNTGAASDLLERLSAIETGLEQRLNDMSRSWAVLSDRLQALELAVRELPAGGAALPADLFERLRATVDLKPIANRLDIIEEALLSGDPKGAAEHSGLTDKLQAIESQIGRALSANSAGATRMEAIMSGFERQKNDLAGALVAPVVERISAVVGSSQAQQASTGEALSKVAERLNAVERALAAEIETAAAKHQAYAHDLREVHDALMKLNQNQHTLAGSIDQWRNDASGDLSVISNRLTNLDRDNERPMATLNALSAHMDTMNKTLIERYHRRNRFWYWLFGTDDWIGASWPSQAAALEAERAKLKAPGAA